MNKLLFFMFGLLVSPVVFGQSTGIVLNPTGLYYSYREATKSTNTDTLNALYYDVRLGYLMTDDIYIGGIYSAMNRDYGSSGTKKRTSYGVSIGYFSTNGLYLIGHYLISSEYDDFNSNVLKKGYGLQADFGYLFELSSSVRVGPQLTYRTYSYSQENNAGTVTSVSLSHTEFLPFVSIAFFL